MQEQMVNLELKLTVPVKTIRKIKAYAVLTGETDLANFVEKFSTEILGSKLDKTVDRLISGELDIHPPQLHHIAEMTPTIPKETAGQETSKPSYADYIESPLTDGPDLSEDEDLFNEAVRFEEEQEEVLYGTPTSSGGVTLSDEELEHDLDVEDTEVEAAAVAEDSSDPYVGEDPRTIADPARQYEVEKERAEYDMNAFANELGIDLSHIQPVQVGFKNPNPRKGRGKASEMNHTGVTSSSFENAEGAVEARL